MNWRLGCGVVCCFLLLIGGTRATWKDSDVKRAGEDELSDSIKHLIRSLEPNPEAKKPRRISPDELITAASLRAAASRKLFFGEELQGSVPAPVVVSSQMISINSANGNNRNKTGGKRARSLVTAVDSDGVKTIEGVRVPDDEHDKFHTWRNARVIKNFLVENNRPANPHKKRQIILSDGGQHYAVTAAPLSAYGPTMAAKVIDMGSYGVQPEAQQYYYTTQDGSKLQTAQQYTTAQDLSAFYSAAALGQQVPYTVQQSTYQAAAASSPSVISYPTGQAADYATQQQQSSQQGQMYILQPDGKTYLPYNPASASSASTAQISQSVLTAADPLRQSSSSSQAKTASSGVPQSTFQSRSGEIDTPIAAVETHPHLRQHAMKLQQEQAYQQLILSKHKFAEQQQQQQQQQQAHTQSVTPTAAPTPQSLQADQFMRKSNEDPVQIAHIAASAIPAGHSIGQNIQEAIAVHSAEVLSAQGPAPIPIHTQRLAPPQHVFQQQQQQQQQIQVVQQGFLQPTGQSFASVPVNPSQFVIQPQTYHTGGGQMFSVPVPVPRDQIERHGGHEEQQQQHQQQNQQNSADKKRNSLTNRLLHSLNLKVDRRTAERVETSAVVPVLSSAGLLLGLGALAASWYLSSSNREVGILKRNGKPAGSATASVPNSANNGGKDKAVVEHLRRRRAADEIDQASFFQSIIQHGIEKTQKTYEPASPAGPVYRPAPPAPAAPAPFVALQPAPAPVAPKLDKLANKSGKGSLARMKAIAHVFIPAIVLGGSVLVAAALIFGWYASGTNREIAFLEPSAYSRRKRSLTPASNSALLSDDSWLHSLIKSISRTTAAAFADSDGGHDALLLNKRNPSEPFYPFLDHSSKSSPTTTDNLSDSDLTNLSVALSMAAFAFGALTVLGLAWYFTDNSRQVAWSDKGPVSFGTFPTAYYGPRVRRSLHHHHRTNRRLSLQQHQSPLDNLSNSVLGKLATFNPNRLARSRLDNPASLSGAAVTKLN